MTDTTDTRPAESEVLIRFYPGGSTIDLRDGDRWVPASLIPPTDTPDGFSAEAYQEALSDLGDAAAFLVHLADVSRGRT